MGKYLAYFKSSIQHEMFYKFNFWMKTFSAIILFFVEFFLWKAVFGNKLEIQNITLAGIYSYIFYSNILRKFFSSGIEERIGEDYRKGNIIIDQLRPVGLMQKYLSEDLGRGVIQTVTLIVPLICIILLTGNQSSLWISRLGIFLLFSALSYIIYFLLNYIIGLICFWTGSILGMYMLKLACIGLLSGIYIPLDFYPDWLARICSVLPFKMIFYSPLSMLLYPKQSPLIILYQYGIWLTVLYGLYLIIQKKAFKRLIVQGG